MGKEALIERWNSVSKEHKYLVINGGLNAENYPFGKTDEGKCDLRGFNFKELPESLGKDGSALNNVVFHNFDFSYSNFDQFKIANCQFVNCTFEVVYCRDLLDIENVFEHCQFHKVDFRRASIGVGNSRFENCTFKACNFMRCCFYSPQFRHVGFVDCNLREFEFGGASFEYCLFEGSMSHVLFKGDDLKSRTNNPGYKKNEMLEVSFENLDFYSIAFSDDCKLDHLKIKSDSNYILVKDFQFKCKELYEMRQQYTDETIYFIELIYGIAFERNQNSYLFNKAECIDEDSNLKEMDEVFEFLKR